MKRRFFELIRGFSTRRSAKFGTNSILMVVIFAAILGIVNFISYNHYRRLDLSYNKDFTLSPQTISVLRNLTKDVKVTGFFQEGSQTKGQFKGLLETYMYHTKRIKFDFVDPDKEPAVAKRYKIDEYDTMLLESGEKEARAKGIVEQELTNAIIRVTREGKRSIYFIEGHGEHGVDDTERSGLSQVKDSLTKQGHDVKKLILMQEGKIPDDVTILVIAGPQKPFLEAEKDLLQSYINSGGQLLLMVDPVTTSGIDEILIKLGVKLGNDVIIDPISRIFGGALNIPVVSNYPRHQITNNFNIITFFPVARSIGFDLDGSNDISFEPVIQTSPSSWAETDLDKRDADFDPKKDTKGPVEIAATVTFKEKEGIDAPKEKRFRLVIFGDSDFSSNAWFSSSGNGDLFLNSVNWLAREEDIISISPKEVKGSRLLLTRTEGRRLFIIPVLLLPSLVLISGLTIWRKRRRL
ncbi:MAG: Gldg family protein [Nitrospirota bacterium]